MTIAILINPNMMPLNDMMVPRPRQLLTKAQTRREGYIGVAVVIAAMIIFAFYMLQR